MGCTRLCDVTKKTGGFQRVMAWMQKDQPEQLLTLASLLIGLKTGWPGSFQLFCYTLRSAKDVDIGLLPGAAFHALGSEQVA